MSVASASTEATAPPNPIEVAVLAGGWGALAATAPPALSPDSTSALAVRVATKVLAVNGASAGSGTGTAPCLPRPRVDRHLSWRVRFHVHRRNLGDRAVGELLQQCRYIRVQPVWTRSSAVCESPAVSSIAVRISLLRSASTYSRNSASRSPPRIECPQAFLLDYVGRRRRVAFFPSTASQHLQDLLDQLRIVVPEPADPRVLPEPRVLAAGEPPGRLGGPLPRLGLGDVTVQQRDHLGI